MGTDDSQNGTEQGQKSRIIAAIPCFNEERFIGSVVVKTKKYVDKVIVVDDGSTDATSEVACGAGAAVCRHEFNQGKGAAIRTAFDKLREEKADVLVIIDGDGQHDAKDIPRLVKPIMDGQADVVVGSRFVGGARKPPYYRRLGQHILTIASNVGSGTTVTDSQSGFRAFSSKAVQSLKLGESGFAVDSEIQFGLRQLGLKVVEVPIQVQYLDRAKRNPVGHGANVLGRLLVLISMRQPFALFGIPGFLLFAGGLGFGIRVVMLYDQTGQVATGSALTALVLCMSGMLALFAALMLQAMKELMRREWYSLQKMDRTAYQGQEDMNGPETS